MKNIDVEAIKEAAMKMDYSEWQQCRSAVDDSFEYVGKADKFANVFIKNIRDFILLCSDFTKRQWFAVSSAIEAQFIGVIDKARIEIADDNWFKESIEAGL